MKFKRKESRCTHLPGSQLLNKIFTSFFLKHSDALGCLKIAIGIHVISAGPLEIRGSSDIKKKKEKKRDYGL